MSVVIQVSSITIPGLQRRPGPIEIHQRNQAIVGYIQETFGWSSIPWDEPSEQKGLETSASNSRFDILLSLAWLIDQQMSSSIDDPLKEIAEILDSFSSKIRPLSQQQYSPPVDGFKHFPQLLNRDIYRSYWLPIEIPEVTLLQFDIHDELSRFSIGSSQLLIKEMEILAQFTQEIIQLKGGETKVLENSPLTYTWGSIHDLSLTLKDGAHQSTQLNLPLGIFW